MSSYLYYKYSSDNFRNFQISIDSSFEIEIFKPKIFKLCLHKKMSINHFFWYIISFGGYRIYYVIFKSRIVHFSHVMPKNFKFNFMRENNSLHIGPCWTDPDFRGKRLYPFILNMIINDNKKTPIYIFTTKDNFSSQRGIELVGFKQMGALRKTSPIGIYKIYN